MAVIKAAGKPPGADKHLGECEVAQIFIGLLFQVASH